MVSRVRILLTTILLLSANGHFWPILSYALSLGGHTASLAYTWKENLQIHYTKTPSTVKHAASVSTFDSSSSSPATSGNNNCQTSYPVVCIPGFGVGTFHYSRNVEEFADQGYDVFSLDLLGQGESWAVETSNNASIKLQYSLDTWAEEIIYFIEKIVLANVEGGGGKVHLVGNSLGGYLSVMITYLRPDLVRSIALLNATPVWAFNQHDDDSEVQGNAGEIVERTKNSKPTSPIRPSKRNAIWNGMTGAGTLPDWVLQMGRFYFQRISNRETVKEVLKTLYQSREAVDSELVEDIVSQASHPGADVVFTSIMFSPKSALSFDEMLTAIDDKHCPICLIYGKQDPWIAPFWGQRIKRMKPRSMYFELSPVGHCPHHEAPHVVNKILPVWWRALRHAAALEAADVAMSSSADLANSISSKLDDSIFADCRPLQGAFPNALGRPISVEIVDGSPRTWVEKLGAYFHEKELVNPKVSSVSQISK